MTGIDKQPTGDPSDLVCEEVDRDQLVAGLGHARTWVAHRPTTKTGGSSGEVVVIERADYESLVAAAENAADLADIAAIKAHVAEKDFLPFELAERILDGMAPVRVWRQHRGLTARALAAKAGLSSSYLSEIETGKKPGSVRALHALATALEVDLDDLVPDPTRSRRWSAPQ